MAQDEVLVPSPETHVARDVWSLEWSFAGFTAEVGALLAATLMIGYDKIITPLTQMPHPEWHQNLTAVGIGAAAGLVFGIVCLAASDAPNNI